MANVSWPQILWRQFTLCIHLDVLHLCLRRCVNWERQCVDTTGTVPVPRLAISNAKYIYIYIYIKLFQLLSGIRTLSLRSGIRNSVLHNKPIITAGVCDSHQTLRRYTEKLHDQFYVYTCWSVYTALWHLGHTVLHTGITVHPDYVLWHLNALSV